MWCLVKCKINRRKNNTINEIISNQDAEFQEVKNKRKSRQVKSFIGTGKGHNSFTPPVEFFVANTSINTTSEDVIKLIAEQTEELGEKVDVFDVKCMNKLTDINQIRSRCWKVSVPFHQKDIMFSPESWPCGWSYRKFRNYSPKK